MGSAFKAQYMNERGDDHRRAMRENGGSGVSRILRGFDSVWPWPRHADGLYRLEEVGRDRVTLKFRTRWFVGAY
jgi:hypothetical protein